MKKRILNASEMGKVGGKRKFEKYGKEHMAQIGAKGRETIKKKDPDFYKRLSAAGVAARLKKMAEKKGEQSPSVAPTNDIITSQ